MPRALESLPCPRCRSTSLRLEGPALACWRCGGLFLRGVIADSVRLALDPRAHAAAERHRGSPFARVDLAGAASCPVCRATMKRLPAGLVDVDTCAAHGTWYDPGELRAVKDALLAGGAQVEAPAPAPPPLAQHAASRSAQQPQSLPSLELADVPPPQRRPSRTLGPAFDFKLEQARERAEAERAASPAPQLDVLGAILGAVGIAVVSAATPGRGFSGTRRRHRRTSSGGLVIRAVESLIYD